MQETTEASKPELAPVPIWRCRNADCKAWMRDELLSEPPKRTKGGKAAAKGANDAVAGTANGAAAERAASDRADGAAVTASADPRCPLCQGPMLRGMKHLPKLAKKAKAAPKKPPENTWLH